MQFMNSTFGYLLYKLLADRVSIAATLDQDHIIYLLNTTKETH